jgi:hypothetical protein
VSCAFFRAPASFVIKNKVFWSGHFFSCFGVLAFEDDKDWLNPTLKNSSTITRTAMFREPYWIVKASKR